MLYSRVAPSGAVTVMVPVFTLQAGCTTVTVGVTGEAFGNGEYFGNSWRYAGVIGGITRSDSIISSCY